MGKNSRNFLIPLSLALPGTLAVGLFLVIPLVTLFFVGFSSLSEAFSYPLLFRTIGLTYGQAVLSAALAGGVGIWSAILCSETSFFWKSCIRVLALVCFSLPQILVVLAFFSFFGRTLSWGFLGWPAILMAHVFLNFGIFHRQVEVLLLSLDRTEELSALSLGASRWRVFFEITLPKLMPAIRGAFILSFIYCSTSFLVILMLGGGPRFTTLEVALYQAVKVELDLPLAVRLGAIQGIVCLGIFLADYVWQSKKGVTPDGSTWVPLYRFRNEFSNLWVRSVFLAIILAFCVGPLFSLVQSGLISVISADWGELFPALKFTILLGLAVGLVSTVIGFGLVYGSVRIPSHGLQVGLTIVCGVPIAVSSILLSLALMRQAMGIENAWISIIIVQSLLALPVVTRPIRDGLALIPEATRMSAMSLGANAWKTLCWVEMPTLRASIATAFLFGMALSLGEVGAVLMFVDEWVVTLPLLMFRSMSSYHFNAAFGAGLILMCLMGIVFALGERLMGNNA